MSRGPVPGLHQTALRGELYACISAFLYGINIGIPFWIWTDNQQLHDFLMSLDAGGSAPDCMDNDHDLFQRIFTLWKQARRKCLFCRVMKVRAHMDLQQINEGVESWAVRGNTAADEAATGARADFSQDFFKVWQAVCRHHDTQQLVRDEIHNHFIRVGEEATASKGDLKEQEARRWAEVEGDEPRWCNGSACIISC